MAVAQLKNPRQHSAITGYAHKATPGTLFMDGPSINTNLLALLINDLRKSATPSSISAKNVVVAIPERYIYSAVFQMPLLTPKQIEKKVRELANKHLPIPLKKTQYDYVLLDYNELQNSQPILFFATENSLVSSISNALKIVGLELIALETKPTAIARALIPFGSIETILIIDMQAKFTRLSITSNGATWLYKVVEYGADEITETIARKLNVPLFRNMNELRHLNQSEYLKTLSETILEIIDESENIIQNFETEINNTNHEKKVERVMLSGIGSELPHIAKFFTNNLRLQTEIAPVLTTSDRKIPPDITIALGLAMHSN